MRDSRYSYEGLQKQELGEYLSDEKKKSLKEYIIRVPVFGVMEVRLTAEGASENQIMRAANMIVARVAEAGHDFVNGGHKVKITGVNQFFDGDDNPERAIH